MSDVQSPVSPNANSRVELSKFARAATIAGLLPIALVILVVYAGRQDPVPGETRCGQTTFTLAALLVVVHLLCEAGGVLAAGIALSLPKDRPDHAPAIWLALAASSLAAWLGIFLWLSFLA